MRVQRGSELRYRRSASAVNLSEGLRHQLLQRRGPSLKTRPRIETIRRAFDARDRARSRGPHDLVTSLPRRSSPHQSCRSWVASRNAELTCVMRIVSGIFCLRQYCGITSVQPPQASASVGHGACDPRHVGRERIDVAFAQREHPVAHRNLDQPGAHGMPDANSGLAAPSGMRPIWRPPQRRRSPPCWTKILAG